MKCYFNEFSNKITYGTTKIILQYFFVTNVPPEEKKRLMTVSFLETVSTVLAAKCELCEK